VPSYDGKARPLIRLFQWCKPDTDRADYASASHPTDTSPTVTCPDGSTAADMAACPASAPATTTNTVPIASPSKPIQVDCPIQDGANKVLNNRNPTACFWVVGPGTGAEQNSPPNPHDGAVYDVDVGQTCTWFDDGENALS